MTDLDAALKALPLFPLHQAVLFPGTLLPLHVFEPRYRTLVRDVLETHGCLSVAHVSDASADMSGNPPIAEVAGVGTIVEHIELPGGRFNILLRGRARVRLQELHFVPPYRRALATLLEAPGDEQVPPTLVASMHAAARSFAELVRQRDPTFTMRLPRDGDTASLCDAYAHQLIVSAKERQQILEALSIKERAQHVTEALTVQRATLSPPSDALN